MGVKAGWRWIGPFPFKPKKTAVFMDLNRLVELYLVKQRTNPLSVGFNLHFPFAG
jgi:hypothetical protein